MNSRKDNADDFLETEAHEIFKKETPWNSIRSKSLPIILSEQGQETKSPLFIQHIGQGLTKPPEHELWDRAVGIELAYNELSELPLSPNCPQLRELKLQGNADLIRIPSSFFSYMPRLSTLDLSYSSVRELPNSFFNLKQIRQLYLKGCKRFMKLAPHIGNLKELEKLDLDETQIIHLPKEIQELTNLQSLTLCFYEYRGKRTIPYSCSTIIPAGVISKLERLEHLSIDVNPEDERWHENVRVILPEILGLELLKILCLYIPQVELLNLIPPHIFKLDFRFVVGHHMQRIITGRPPIFDVKFKQNHRSLKFVRGVAVPSEIRMLLSHCNAFFLDRHMTIKNFCEFETMNLEQLRICILTECKEMQTIVHGSHTKNNKDALSNLLLLSVSYMKNLTSICKGPTPSRQLFGMLKYLGLHSCPKLTTVFTLDFLGNCSMLKELIIKDCPQLRTLITHDSYENITECFLPNLRKLSLLHLPELISISNGLHIAPSLERIGFYDCPKLQSLSKMELSSEKLMVIKGETNWWERLEWGEVEWGKLGRPSQLNLIFSSINNETDVMSQLGPYIDEDIHDNPGEKEDTDRDFRQQETKRRLAVSEQADSSAVSGQWMNDIKLYFEPLIRNMVREEIQRLQSSCCSSTATPQSRGRALQLRFMNKVSPTIFTFSNIVAEDGAPLRIALCDARSQNCIVNEGPLSSIKIEICVLNGDFGSNGIEDWTAEDFKANITTHHRKGKRPLLNGNRFITLEQGVGFISKIVFTDNSSWIRCRKFCLGAKTVEPTSSHGADIREGKSEPFIVKDNRGGELYKKHEQPSLNDEIWRLKKIAKNGKIHERLSLSGITTVKDLLRLHITNPTLLKEKIGRIPRRSWDIIIEHAKACVIENAERYIYYTGEQPKGLVFNCIYEVVEVTFDGQEYRPLECLNPEEKRLVERVKQHAYKNLVDFIPVQRSHKTCDHISEITYKEVNTCKDNVDSLESHNNNTLVTRMQIMFSK